MKMQAEKCMQTSKIIKNFKSLLIPLFIFNTLFNFIF
jgi:hypothetical protein